MGEKDRTKRVPFTGKAPFETPCMDGWAITELCRLSNNMALRFHCPLFLVGSALTRKHPLDIDIMMVTHDTQYNRILGPYEDHIHEHIDYKIGYFHRRWMRFLMKQKEYYEHSLCHYVNFEVDFKMQRFDRFYHPGFESMPKQRLDFFSEFF